MVDYNALRQQLDGDTTKNSTITTRRVEVNQRALIDKILARYATASAVYRELLQNSNDAGAQTAEILFETDNNNNNKVTSVTYRNNGMPFRGQDWERLQKIAEGNPDVSKIGAFGVGAYTIFSIAEEPVVLSGNTCLLFCWQGDALYTKSTTLSSSSSKDNDDDEWTTFVLPSRDPYNLPNWTEFGEFLISALTFTNALQNIVVKVNGIQQLQLSKSILQPPRPIPLLSSSSKNSSSWWDTVTAISSSASSSSSTTRMKSKNGLFSLGASASCIRESLVRVTVEMEQCQASMDARYVSGLVQTHIPKQLAHQMHRVTKKQPPGSVEIQVFLNYSNYSNSSSSSSSSTSKTLSSSSSETASAVSVQQIAQSFAPNIGKIFIGFQTSQTTGVAAHVAAPFIPTVEREAMDLQNPALAVFNTELLEMAGMVMRFTLEHAMHQNLGVKYAAQREQLEALDQKLLLQHQQHQQQSKMSKSNGTTASKSDTTTTPTATTSTGDKQDDEEGEEDSSTTIMSFARFMAKGVQKKIVSVAKSVLTDGGESSRDRFLLNPPDPRPLCDTEQQAIVLMQSFCPRQSTPDPAVGTALANGFSRCMPNTSPPVLTRSGVLPGNEALLPNYGMEAFVPDTVVRKIVYENAQEYCTIIAQCRKLQFDNLIHAISKKVLSEEKAVKLVQWWTKFSKIDAPHSAQMRGERLKELIRYYPKAATDSSLVCKLSDFLFFVEKHSSFSKRDLLPLPDTVLPHRLQDAIGHSFIVDDALRDTWFSPLPMEIWAEFISHHGCMNDAKPEDDLLRVNVLTVLSQEFMKRPSSERPIFGGFCHSLLADKQCIPFDSDQPTQFAAACPADLYLYSAELKAFDGMASFHKVAASLQTAGVTDEFLLMLGVRKSVSIDFLFANLDKLSWSQDPRPLVEYLRSATLTNSDFGKLSSSRYLPASNDKSKTYAPGELYLPNDDLRIFPFINMLHWPSESIVSPKSANGKFLERLGMKPMPLLTTLLSFLSSDDTSDELRLKGIEFVCDRLGPHGLYYPKFNSMGLSEKKKYRFLPCIVQNPLEPEQPLVERQSPVSCFSDASCGIMGFPVIDPKLGKKGKLYGSLFQCDSEPPSNYLLNQLAHLVAVAKKKTTIQSCNADTVLRVETAFAEIFKYLSHRSSDLNYSSLASLKNTDFIPYKTEDGTKIVWYRPSEIFFKRADRGDDTLTEELFHVIEFSPFLAAAGVKEEATTKDLFQKMVKSPEDVLRTLGSEKKYRSLLRRVAADPPFAVANPPREVKNAPFLLAYTVKPVEEKSDKAAEDKLTYHLAKAADIFIIDNANYGRIFPVYRAPPTDLEDFYSMLGSRYISKSVERRYEIVGSPSASTELTLAFKERLLERGPLLVSPSVTSRQLVAGAAAMLDGKHLEVYQTTNILAVYTLGKTSRRNRVTCCSRELGRKKNAIYITSDLDFFDAGMAIGSLILKRCQLEDAFFISSLLEAPLDQLKARGFPVDRILQPEPVVVPEEAPVVPVSAAKNTPANGADNSVAAKPPPTESSKKPPAASGSKADILKQMFPDADPSFIEAALGVAPSVDDVRDLAEKMSTGHYPKKTDNVSDAGTAPTSNASVGDSIGTPSPPHSASPTKKNKTGGLRKKLGRAFGGKRGSSFGGAQLPPIGGPSIGYGGQGGGSGIVPPVPTTSTENRAPVSPASDAHTQSSLEKILENSVGTASKVQKNGVESPETTLTSTLTSIPQELDRGESCEVIPGQSLKPFLGPRGNGKTHNEITVFASNVHSSSEEFLTCNEASLGLFADVLERLCVEVFGLNLASIAIYHDPAGNSIAFNSNRALHFNFRFFHALHYLQNKHASSECYSYWYVTISHELAHNFVSGHSREHGFYTESFSCHYMPKLVAMLQSLGVN